MSGTSQTPAGVTVWLVLAKAAQSLETHARLSIQAAGVGLSDFAVLEALLHKGPLPVNTVGSKVLLTSGAMTAVVDRLENKGLVARADDPKDRRARLVKLTPIGRRLVTRAFAAHTKDMERAAAGLSGSERESLIGLLRKLGLSAEAMLKPTAATNSQSNRR